MRGRLALAALGALTAPAAVAACGGDPVTTPANARVVARLRATQIGVGDTLTVRVGVLFADGRFTPVEGFSVASLDTLTLAVRAGTAVIEGRRPGQGRMRIQVAEPQVTVDTAVAVLP